MDQASRRGEVRQGKTPPPILRTDSPTMKCRRSPPFFRSSSPTTSSSGGHGGDERARGGLAPALERRDARAHARGPPGRRGRRAPHPRGRARPDSLLAPGRGACRAPDGRAPAPSGPRGLGRARAGPPGRRDKGVSGIEWVGRPRPALSARRAHGEEEARARAPRTSGCRRRLVPAVVPPAHAPARASVHENESLRWLSVRRRAKRPVACRVRVVGEPSLAAFLRHPLPSLPLSAPRSGPARRSCTTVWARTPARA